MKNIIIAATIALSTLTPTITNAQSYYVKCDNVQKCGLDWNGVLGCWVEQYCCKRYCNAYAVCYSVGCWWQ